MGDTFQNVIWSLERSCQFRAGQEWYLPGTTFSQLHDLETVSEMDALGGIVDEICITAAAFSNPELEASGIRDRLPACGFEIEQRLAKYGGLAEAKKVCGKCEANAHRGSPTEVAGCFGDLLFDPDSADLDQSLWAIINERNLDGPFRAAFPVTTPLWYGLWIDSPLRRPQAVLLLEVFKYAFRDDVANSKELVHFCAAIEAAIAWDLPMHVCLHPRGYAIGGWRKDYPHCPRCHARTRSKSWPFHYFTTSQSCRVCGHVFIPIDNSTITQSDWLVDPDLEEILGKPGYHEFLRSYLRQRGYTTEQIDRALAATG